MRRENKIAIDNEDFDAAKIIKTEIDRLRKTALDPAFNQGPYSDQPEPTEQHRPFSGGPEAPYASSKPPGRGLEEKMGGMDINDAPTEPKPKMAINKKNLFGAGPGKGPQFPSSGNLYEEEKKVAAPMKPSVPQDIDEQVIPAARNKGGASPMDDGMAMDDGKVTDSEVDDSIQIPAEFAKMIPILGEKSLKKLFSKNWNHRVSWIEDTEQAVMNNGDSDTIIASLWVASHAIKDKISQVVLKSFDLINLVMSVWQEPAPSEANGYIDDIASGIASRVGDNNSRIRETSLECGVEFAAHPIAGHALVIDHLTRTGTKKNMSNSVRQQVGKLKLLGEILTNTSITKPQEQRECLNFALAGYKNSNKDIRESAYRCIIELYKVMGDSIKKFLGDLRPAQIDNLQNGFNEVDGVDPGMQTKDSGPKVTIETNITPYGAKSKKGYQEGPQDGDLDMINDSPSKFESSFKADSNAWQFCGKYELGWDGEALDMHYWKDCPMLTPWFGWSQILEIANLNDHLLNEWDNAQAFQQCPRWKEPVPEEEFNFHTEEGAWNIAKDPSEANRCPLCHEDIYPPGEDGWKQHLLIDTCPNNERHP